MAVETGPSQSRDNNFTFVRLILATLVIVSHSPELVDGNRSREILTRIFGTLSFGEIAVDGFFLISGYLITKSFEQSSSIISFFEKRLLRIVPGFLVCFLICVLCLAPLVGGAGVFDYQTLDQQVRLAAKLLPPKVPGAIDGLPYPALNGSMWTISYEFRCYLAAAILGFAGLYTPRNRRWLLLPVGACFVLGRFGSLYQFHYAHEDLFGGVASSIRFYTAFGTGRLFYLARYKLDFRPAYVSAAAGTLFVFMFVPKLAEPALILFGGYILLAFALRQPGRILDRVGKAPDISYGLYLYAWPVQNTMIWHNRHIDPWVVVVATVGIAGCLGYISWECIEKPAMNVLRRRSSNSVSLVAETPV